MGWDIDPEAFENLIVRVRKEYTEIPVYITENGSAWQDVLDQGCVHDADRTLYMEKYIDIVDRLNEKGMNIKGYFCWSLLDNFEWPSGYSQRFGIVYVDYLSQKRIKKDSYFTYQHIIEKHRNSHIEKYDTDYCRIKHPELNAAVLYYQGEVKYEKEKVE